MCVFVYVLCVISVCTCVSPYVHVLCVRVHMCVCAICQILNGLRIHNTFHVQYVDHILSIVSMYIFRMIDIL